ncbi:hypothetical protein BD410DRAFT_447247 [Rickenella mellea]|uniref:Uncharacterized protein n=1 Tax=Rickenella mellea TaxID=50990 RepID=A0A4Y7PVK8_9AGAM|nr:hypothetical protein BD410DRAFT_447247 [Rickenella mellea]
MSSPAAVTLKRRNAIGGGSARSTEHSLSAGAPQTIHNAANITGKDVAVSETMRPATTPATSPEHLPTTVTPRTNGPLVTGGNIQPSTSKGIPPIHGTARTEDVKEQVVSSSPPTVVAPQSVPVELPKPSIWGKVGRNVGGIDDAIEEYAERRGFTHPGFNYYFKPNPLIESSTGKG